MFDHVLVCMYLSGSEKYIAAIAFGTRYAKTQDAGALIIQIRKFFPTPGDLWHYVNFWYTLRLPFFRTTTLIHSWRERIYNWRNVEPLDEEKSSPKTRHIRTFAVYSFAHKSVTSSLGQGLENRAPAQPVAPLIVYQHSMLDAFQNGQDAKTQLPVPLRALSSIGLKHLGYVAALISDLTNTSKDMEPV